MNHLKLIHEYLKDKGSLEGFPSTGYPFVTISRQAGAGGHLLSHVLLTDILKEEDTDLFTGWHVFDREICEIVACDTALHASLEALLSDRHRSEFKDFIESLFTGHSEQYLQQKRMFRVVRLLGLLGKVFIVGCAAALVVRDLPSGVHVRLVASESSRVHGMVKKLQVSREEALKMIHQQDTDRRKNVRTLFNRDVDDPLVYDAVFNTDTTDMHDISAAIIGMLKRRHLKARGA
jgi:hypothetical protein